jgi:pimeloyl-ACP methyl ester carboxylesterase
MPVVFVHGVPDTQRVWDAVVSRLDRRDVIRLSLPRFGCPAPAGFNATKEACVD